MPSFKAMTHPYLRHLEMIEEEIKSCEEMVKEVRCDIADNDDVYLADELFAEVERLYVRLDYLTNFQEKFSHVTSKKEARRMYLAWVGKEVKEDVGCILLGSVRK